MLTETTSLPFRIRFLCTEHIRFLPFASLAERDDFLKIWAEVRRDQDRPAPAEGTDYELEDPRQSLTA